ncbi:hypothetical protein C8R47DRAFT_662505 [Mycena vitilis]|nr:hypothetical protein C8R47DRAFT_662505 [Mycena vitilis]
MLRDMHATRTVMGSASVQMMQITADIRPILNALSPPVPHPWFDQMEFTMKEATMIRVKDTAIQSLLLPAFFLACFICFLALLLSGKTTMLARIVLIPMALISGGLLIPALLSLLSVFFSYSWLRGSAPRNAYLRLVHLRNLNQCMNLKCLVPLGGKTAVCVQCGIVRYCGQQCQRPAWRADHLPHKALCDTIHALRVALELEKAEDWERWVLHAIAKDTESPTHRAPRFHVLCKEKRVQDELVLGAMHGLSALVEAKRAQLEELELQQRQDADGC